MNIWQKWNSISLVKRILVGLVIGAILGFCVPAGNEAVSYTHLARIAYLRDEQALAFEHGSGERGAHAVAPDALAGGLHHVVVGCFNRSGESFGIEMAGCEFGKRIHGDLGSDLACFMTAHAICYGCLLYTSPRPHSLRTTQATTEVDARP